MSEEHTEELCGDARQNDSALHILLWSILFSPIFGAYLLRENWKRVGDDTKEKCSNYWLMGLFVAYVIMCIFFFSWLFLFLFWLVWAVIEWRVYYMLSKNDTDAKQYHSIKFPEALNLFRDAILAALQSWSAFFDKLEEQWSEKRTNGQGNTKQILCILGVVAFFVLICILFNSTSSPKVISTPEDLLEEYEERFIWLFEQENAITPKNQKKSQAQIETEVEELIEQCRVVITKAQNKGIKDRVIFERIEKDLGKICDDTEYALEQVGGLPSKKITSDYIKYGNPTRVLIKCVENCDYDHLDELFSVRRVNINAVSSGFTALSVAVLMSDEKMVEYLLKKGANPNLPEKAFPPLFWVKTAPMLKLLLRYGCNINQKNYDGENVLEFMISHQEDAYPYGRLSNLNIELAKAIIDSGLDVNYCSNSHDSLLAKCVSRVRALCERDEINSTSEHVKELEIYYEIFKYLLKHKINTEAELSVNQTPLLYVLSLPDHTNWTVRFTNELVKAGANVNAVDYHANTPLHYAAKSKNEAVIIKSGLLAKLTTNFTINAKDEDGDVPLYYAFLHSNYVIADYLINHGADPNTKHPRGYGMNKDKYGEPVLINAVRSGKVNLVKSLLDKGADPNIKATYPEWSDSSPLDIAVEKNYCEIAQLLISSGAIYEQDTINHANSAEMKEILSSK